MADENNTEENNANNVEDSDTVTLTLNEVLELEDELIENTAAVLGAANDKTCSYVEGYLKRQALYSCLTCIPEAKEDPEKGAGICLACSYHCHDGHDLVELYTKRNFRCDCGNSKFPNLECNLFNEKSDINDLNSYNQNFSGFYCVCHRPYPDPEDPVPDEMVQCIICEDWYHTRHLGTEVPSNNFSEMICEACVKKNEFLLHYDDKAKKPSQSAEGDTSEEIDPITWRKELCTCDDCLRMYENEDVAFLLDPEDPVHLYEEKGKAKAKEIVENHDRDFMNSLNRVQLVDCIAGYNDLKEHLAEYLKKFAENKKIVREEDIREFFEGMNARKKQRVEVPHYCR
ncbi:hypothetical protein NQ315_017167 [Exocentrus adspersus]|uniref:UBR-type domain-containing protein n=1 Tax=Exocentrus adspersus TaxID=1586481 RepID=A0AAV8VGU7_9CUCU|nr:hypothetical protein NQ315_017167 [Exocentrus adspersus]